jgi:hypothetical protein
VIREALGCVRRQRWTGMLLLWLSMLMIVGF